MSSHLDFIESLWTDDHAALFPHVFQTVLYLMIVTLQSTYLSPFSSTGRCMCVYVYNALLLLGCLRPENNVEGWLLDATVTLGRRALRRIFVQNHVSWCRLSSM